MKRSLTYIITTISLVIIALCASIGTALADEPITIPDHRIAPRVVDNAYLFDADERESLTTLVDELSDELQFDVTIVTTETLDGKSPRVYADDFYDSHGYGFGTQKDGVILLISINTRDWYISTTGYGIYAITDYGIDYIGDQIVKDLGKGHYYQACKTFAKLTKSFVLEARHGKPYDINHTRHAPINPLTIPIGLVIGGGIAFIIARSKKSKLTSVVGSDTARDYAVSESLSLIAQNDRFLRKNVTSYIESDSSSSSGTGGGSSTHFSSSGSSHGGGGGKF